MQDEAKRRGPSESITHGGLLIDEMQIQSDIQVKRQSTDLKLVGMEDMGPLNNSIKIIKDGKKKTQLATHALQIEYVSFNGFRWPVAYYASTNCTCSELFNIFWEVVDALDTHGFTVIFCSLDGASSNRSFIRMHFSGISPLDASFTAANLVYPQQVMIFIQDIKHCLKKIRNNILSSKGSHKSSKSRYLMLNGKCILWDHFIEASKYNTNFELKIHKKLTPEHVERLSSAGKMRNHLAIDVLDFNIFRLMQKYSATLSDQHKMDSTIDLLSQTQVLIKIFQNRSSKMCITSNSDYRIQEIKNVLSFFQKWESSETNKRHLFSQKAREDIASCLSGFISLVHHVYPLGININPGYLNSDGIENFFCQLRGTCHGNNTNPNLLQYGPAVNAIIISQPTISRKGNTGELNHTSIPKFKKHKSNNLQPKQLHL